MDIWSKQKRSEVMSKIRGKNTKPELILRSLLFKQGYRFKVHQKDLPGKPDIVLPKFKTTIFVHGCFWHHHKGCRDGRIPSTNKEFWDKKIRRNIIKDRENMKELKKDNWTVIVIWECDIEKHPDKVINYIQKILNN
jgi:DNA mismatch endonuclease (patch repair protein)